MIKSLLAVLFLLISSASRAQLLCRSVYSLDNIGQRRAQVDVLLKRQLTGSFQEGLKELYFYWHSAYPFQVVKTSSGALQTAFSRKRMVVYQNSKDGTSNSGLEHMGKLFGRSLMSNQTLLESYLKVYQTSADPKVIESIRALEEEMRDAANERQSFGLVATAPAWMGGEVLGTFRVYNGVPTHTLTPANLPLEYNLAKNGIFTKVSKELKLLREENPNALIFELGRLSIHGSPEATERTKALLDLFLLRKYLDVLPDDSLFYAQCATKLLARANQQHFGFEIIETVEVPGKGTQYILKATAAKIRQTFEKRYGLAPRGIQILHPQ